MKTIYFCICVLYFVHLLTLSPQLLVNSQDTPTTTSPSPDPPKGENNSTLIEYNEDNSYCFRFTWMGPEYDNSSAQNGFNTSCQDLMDEKRVQGAPCKMPLVITYDATPPDMDYLWENYKTNVICRRSRGQVCAKYEYSFNGAVQNITYMCSKVFAKDEGEVTSGCYTFKQSGYDMRLCVCEGSSGGYMPCNTGNSLIRMSMSGFAAILVTHLFWYYINQR